MNWLKRLNPPSSQKIHRAYRVSLQDQSSCYKTAFYIFKLGEVTTLVV